MKYAFIERNRRRWPISVLCEVLDVSPSGFHQRRQRIAQDKPREGVQKLGRLFEEGRL